jgi:hypothetical protein
MTMVQHSTDTDYTDVRNLQDEFIGIQPEPAVQETRQKTEETGSIPERNVRFKDLIDGTILVRRNMIRQLPYILFLTMLGIVYIANRFYAERMVRKIDELKNTVSNLRAEQITTTSELMNISRPSQVSTLVQERNLGLKESLEPPKKLKRR